MTNITMHLRHTKQGTHITVISELYTIRYISPDMLPLELIQAFVQKVGSLKLVTLDESLDISTQRRLERD